MSTKTDPRYAIIGNGRLARHLCHYFSLLDIPFRHFTRNDLENHRSAFSIPRVLLAVSDSAIEDLAASLRKRFDGATFVHFSGALVTELAESAHPLMTFSDKLYSLDTYKKIPFVTEHGRQPFKILFPDLSNPSETITPHEKPLYHALCVVGGNFSQILWSEVLKTAQNKMGLSKEIFQLFAETSLKNVFEQGESAITGPLVRGDRMTVSQHQAVLHEQSLGSLYQAFVDHFQQTRM